MRREKDFLGEVSLPEDALHGIHSFRARENFPNDRPFPPAWYRAMGKVKQACYQSIRSFRDALEKEHPDLLDHLSLPEASVLEALEESAREMGDGRHQEHFIVPAVQGGAGTSIHMNVNEILANRALQLCGKQPGTYRVIDPIESANLYQSTNDVVPTALSLACMEKLNGLEKAINQSRRELERLEDRGRNSLRLAYTQMQEAVPSTFGLLFSAYNDALSRDWWRVSKAFERIKVVNLGGGATGTAVAVPRYYLMEVVGRLKRLSGLPIAQGENLSDATSNLDKWVEVHAILKAHAVNLEKMASDLRLLSSAAGSGELALPEQQVGSSIMPGKVNPVIPEFIISAAHQVYANDHLVTSLCAQGQLELNAYLPQIGVAMLESLDLLLSMNTSLRIKALEGLSVNEEVAKQRLFKSAAVCTALSPLVGYHQATLLARTMKERGWDVFDANEHLGMLPREQLEKLLQPGRLLQKGFTVKDIREVK
jgi:aspartate ammonia-lyase